MGNSFSEDDKKKVIEFLNMVTKHSMFNINTLDLINYYKLLQYMQHGLLTKINANILEVIKVVEPEKGNE